MSKYLMNFIAIARKSFRTFLKNLRGRVRRWIIRSCDVAGQRFDELLQDMRRG